MSVSIKDLFVSSQPTVGMGVEMKSLFGGDVPESPLSQIDLTPNPISDEEWAAARSSPTCIVEDYLFEDVALMVGQGGISKTTLMIYEAAHIALGIPLYGKAILTPGMTVYLTAEDDRENIVAATRSVCAALNLTEEQRAKVKDLVRPIYVGATSFRLCKIEDDVVVIGEGTLHLAESLSSIADRLRVLVIDPTVSFGVGESRVNDAEQGLVSAGRYLRDNLKCCVRYVHHTGQSNARNKVSDQYSGRGGTAMPDGARMVHVLNKMDLSEWLRETGEKLDPGESGIRLSIPKLKFTRPQPDILVVRKGYSFTWVKAKQASLTSEQFDALLETIRGLKEPPRKDVQSPLWFGHHIAAVLGKDSGEGLTNADLDEDQKAARNYVKPIAARLLSEGLFETDKQKRKTDARMQEIIVIPEQEVEE